MAFSRLKSQAGLLSEAFRVFRQNDPLRMSAATAFFTSFALPAILIILIQVFGLLLGPKTFSDQLFENLAGIIGRNTVAAIRQTLRNVRLLASTWYIALGGFLFLVFVSTTLFKVIKDSINQLWSVRISARTGILHDLRHRFRSFLAIIFAGVLFLAVILAEGFLAILKQYISSNLPQYGFLLNFFLSQLVSVIVVTSWFAMLFKLLPDAQTRWRIAIAGAFFTGILFTFGKWILRWLLSYSNMHTIYGTSTSIVLLLLFVFYASGIFYYGACFTHAWAEYKRQPIRPSKGAVKYIISHIQVG